MKAFPSFPVLSVLALAIGVTGVQAQTPPVQSSPVSPPVAASSPMPQASTPPAAASPATPSSSAESATSQSSPTMPPDAASRSSAESATSDRFGGRYGRGYDYGPGRMGGYGGGMMGGYGPGYGGSGGGNGPGWGMGPGMMGGPGAGFGPGMMGGPGWGPGMMGGHGPGWGMGPGRALGSVDLDDSQRKQLRELQQEQRRRHWALMGQMHEEMEALHDAWGADSGTRDRAAILASSKRLAELRQQMLESQLDAADALDAILTPEQREQLRSPCAGSPGRERR